MIPYLFSSEETNFTGRGLGRLSDAITCSVVEERNGAYELTMTYPVNGAHYAEIHERYIITAIPSPYRTAQPFRIYLMEEPLNGIVTIHARHLSYDLSGIPVEMFSTSSNVSDALTGLVNHAAATCPFSVYTDKTTAGSFTLAHPMSFKAALGGQEGSILDTFGGGEFLFDGYTVNLLTARGSVKNYKVAYAKNIVDFKRTNDMEKLVTGIYPYWQKDGVTQTLTRKVVEIYENAAVQNVLTVDLTDRFDTKPTKADLLTAAEKYIDENHLGLKDVSLDVSFVDLAQFDEYGPKAGDLQIDLCDTVTVVFPAYGVETASKIVRIETNVLQDRYEYITIGRQLQTVADTLAGEERRKGTYAVANNNNKMSLFSGIPYGTVGGTSSSTVKTADVEGFTAIYDGATCIITNDGTASATGWTMNVNGLGAYKVFQSQSGAAITTTYAANSTYMFTFSEALDSGNGGWYMYYGYNSNDNTVGYNIRNYQASEVMASQLTRYKVCFTRRSDGKLIPSTATSNSTATTKTLTTEAWDPFAPIWWYSTTGSVAADASPGAS